ncbi:topoisomerase 3alpha [Actinidia rufa]|uniref:Topoisomerase 3alpha n=1 Tax=Actinidia rufa TaxID=165716 RepID=A0A7J0ELU9_9ERIC|nr:topoisomerase 3alpha [Actinidia rufa]
MVGSHAVSDDVEEIRDIERDQNSSLVVGQCYGPQNNATYCWFYDGLGYGKSCYCLACLELAIFGPPLANVDLSSSVSMCTKSVLYKKIKLARFSLPNDCRNAVWLPGSIAEATVTTNVCSICTPGPVFLIQFKFRRLEIPPNYNTDHLGCIGGCDEILKQLVEICGTGSRNASTIPARGWGHSTSSSSTQRSNSRQIACTHCGQYGHSSHDCPSQSFQSSRSQSHGMNQQNGESSIPCETCGTPCNLRTANTANNKGRKFYSCQSQGCNFFVWEDSLGNSNGGRSAPRANNSFSASNARSRGGRGRGGQSGRGAADVTFVSATGDPVSGRRCFVCGDPSHFANVCPNRDM